MKLADFSAIHLPAVEKRDALLFLTSIHLMKS